MRLLLRLAVTAVALWVAVLLVPGIDYVGPWYGLLGVALVFGAINAFVRPLLTWLTCPLIVLTLGLFVFILNAVLFWMAAAVSGMFGLEFEVQGFLPALLGAIVVGLVSAVLNLVVGGRPREKED